MNLRSKMVRKTDFELTQTNASKGELIDRLLCLKEGESLKIAIEDKGTTVFGGKLSKVEEFSHYDCNSCNFSGSSMDYKKVTYKDKPKKKQKADRSSDSGYQFISISTESSGDTL